MILNIIVKMGKFINNEKKASEISNAIVNGHN